MRVERIQRERVPRTRSENLPGEAAVFAAEQSACASIDIRPAAYTVSPSNSSEANCAEIPTEDGENTSVHDAPRSTERNTLLIVAMIRRFGSCGSTANT